MRSFFFYNTTTSRSHSEQGVQEGPFFAKESDRVFFDQCPASSGNKFFPSSTVQTKPLTVSQPGDPYEQEADAVADQVVERLNGGMSPSYSPVLSGGALQSKCTACDSAETVAGGEQEEQLQKKEEPPGDRISSIQRKPIFESEEDGSEATGAVQRKCAECEQEEKVQRKESQPEISEIMTSGLGHKTEAPLDLDTQLNSSKGGGQPLTESTRTSMESQFGTDFSSVKVHTEQPAVKMNKDLNAQAFTHGRDIYFNEGKYDDHSREGKHLLAHELTHVVQQGESVKIGQIQRICDNIPEVNNQFYGHGAYMGAAPQLMVDRKWNRILQVLMPDVHSDVTSKMAAGSGSDDIILMLENNPVMGAFGVYQTHQMDLRNENDRSDRISKMQAMEWDVFLPTSQVENYHRSETDEERLRLSAEIVDEMLIAHGTPWQTIKENAPVGDSRQYANVVKTRKSGQGGVRPGAWMDLFGRALQLATAENLEERAAEYEDPQLHPRVDSPEDQASHQTFQNQLRYRDVVDLYKQLFNKGTFSVLLDIKSRDATPTVLRAVVLELNRRGVHVYGVGSFQHHETAGLSDITQVVNGERHSGPTEIKFFHLAGDLQKACLDNKIAEGDTVMFNAGSLVNHSRVAWSGPRMKASYSIKNEVVDQLRLYKQHFGFHLGVYVQENDIDDRAATLITELVNANLDIFDLGFAWGGLSGQTASDIEPTRTHATVGIAGQGILGSHWDTRKPLPGVGSLVSPRGGFDSTISIRHRFLESRRFAVSSGTVTVTCHASWNDPACSPNTYYITLLKDISVWPDSEHGTVGYPVGQSNSATLTGLESGNYYLQIYFNTDTNPNCVLNGDITVST